MTKNIKVLSYYILIMSKKKINKKDYDLFTQSVISKKVIIPFEQIGGSLKQQLEKNISRDIEGKCIVEGYIEPKSVKVLTYSSGLLKGNNIHFDVVYECRICYPVEGMHINAIIKNITQAGIRAEIDVEKTPLIIYIARDHHFNSNYFTSLKEGDKINTRVIGIRFELNDPYISVMSEVLEEKHIVKKKPKLNIIE
jgi:DNA-directed RNA polymerase subunit E'/Rpb7